MKRSEVEQYIMENYSAVTDYPWAKYPTYQVFRHKCSGKWFALIMDVPREKLDKTIGCSGEEEPGSADHHDWVEESAPAPGTRQPAAACRKTVSPSSDMDVLPVINVKCDQAIIGSFRYETGFFPAYHMNKENWITANLDAVSDGTIQMLIDMSFELTSNKYSRRTN